ncbi:MAG: sugar nucleotide-binding protein [Pseudomonadales bacterium]
MKVLVIALDAQIRDALETQLSIRNRVFESVGLEWFQSAKPDVQRLLFNIPQGIGVVVNAISLECLERKADGGLIEPLRLLAQACERESIPLIQLSNSQVFDSIDGGRNREDDPVVPASRIGALLGRIEDLVRGSCKRHIILRSGPLFSSKGDNLLTVLLKSFQQGETLSLSNVGTCCPVHTSDLARIVSAIIDQLSCGAEPWGSYHYCSSDPASSYLFAETVLAVVMQYAKASDHPLQLEALETIDSRWPRPLLNCEKILNTFGIKQLSWRMFVVPTVKKIFQSEEKEQHDEQQLGR